MPPKVLYIDMDNVLVDFPSGIARLPQAVVAEYDDRLDEVPGIFFLAGTAWEIQSQRVRAPRYFLRRIITLALFGTAFHAVWPTEILLPLALMMAVALYARSLGPRALLVLAALIAVSTPALHSWMHPAITGDWSPDEAHRAELGAGWATVRFLLIDGNYPVVPWLLFALAGMRLFAQGLPDRARMRRWSLGALLVAAGAQAWALWSHGHAATLGGASYFLQASWVPTTLPFVVLTGGAAVFVAAGLLALDPLRLRRRAAPLAALGRASLTHYVAHIVLVYVPMRAAFPDDAWPVRHGFLAFVAYSIIAAPLSMLWFRRYAHGPLERLWVAASGPASPA